jgi:uncharacterized protein (TIGR03437 family)
MHLLRPCHHEFRLCSFLFAFCATISYLSAQAPQGTARFSRLPLEFEENQGQFDPRARFVSRTPGFDLTLTKDEAILALEDRSRRSTSSASLRLTGANYQYGPDGLDRLPGMTNYLIGNDRSMWKTGIARYGQVRYRNVYPGIDVTYYGSGLMLEYDFVLRPGANASSIALSYDGIDSLRLGTTGDLIIGIAGRQVVQHRPVAYQLTDAGREPVIAGYHVNSRSKQVRIRVGPYDHTRTLVIDPVLDYGTFFGGTGFDGANSLAVDLAGNTYITGYTQSANLPAAGQRVFQQSLRGGGDAFVAKLNPSGTGLVYVTYLGGTGDDQGTSIAVDSGGNAYVCGLTSSSNFPTKGPVISQFAGGRSDGFLSVLNSAGTDLDFSLYVGGPGDDVANALALDPRNNIYVAGYSTSTAMTSITLGAPQRNNAGGSDAFLIKFTSSGSLVYGSFFGGTGDEHANGVAVDTSGVAYVVGDSTSKLLPGLSSRSFQATHKAAKSDAFLFQMAPDGAAFTYSTFLGGSSDQSAYAVTLLGNLVYLTGSTNSLDFPLAGAPVQPTNRGDYDAFVSVFSLPNLNYSSYLGGSGADTGYSIVADRNGNIFVAGYTDSPDFLQNSANQPKPGGNTFVLELGSSAAWESIFGSQQSRFSTVLATYLVASGRGNPVRLAVRAGPAADEIFVAGYGDSRLTFPSSTARPLFSYAGGSSDAFIAKLANSDVSITIGAIGAYVGTTTAGTGNIIQGGDVLIPIVLFNAGPAAAGNVTFSLQLPTGLTLLRCQTQGVTCSSGGGVVTGTVSSLLAGGTQGISVIAKASSSLAGQTLQLTATVLSGNNDVNPVNNTATARFSLSGTIPFTTNPPNSFDFGTVPVGQSRSTDVLVIPVPNSGFIDLQLVLRPDPGVAAGVFSFAAGTVTRPTLGANQRAVTVVYRPDSTNPHSAQLDLIADAKGYTPTVLLSGQGAATYRPPPMITAVEDGAGFRPLIAANDWVSIKGSNFIDPDHFPDPNKTWRVWEDRDFQGNRMPTTLDDISVMINGKPAYVYYISPTQINVLSPRDPVSGIVSVDLTTPNGQTSATVQKDAVAPGLFMVNMPTRNYVASTTGSQATFAYVGIPQSPAQRGRTISLYLGGLGDTTPAYSDSTAISETVNTNATPIVTIGGFPVTVDYSGMTPGAGGLYQLNLTLPANLPLGDQLVVVQLLNHSTQPSVYITIAP